MLVDITAVDYLHYPDAKDRFGVVYLLTNTATGERSIVKTFLNEPDLTIPSVFPLWRGADWMEREVYDMYGLEFRGPPGPAPHPDARRFRRLPVAEGLSTSRLWRTAQLPALTRSEG